MVQGDFFFFSNLLIRQVTWFFYPLYEVVIDRRQERFILLLVSLRDSKGPVDCMLQF